MTNEEHGEQCFVEFQWAEPTEKDPTLHIVAWHGKARLHVDFDNETPEGRADLTHVVQSMPQILSHIFTEMKIKREVDSVDQELKDLLGDEGA